MDAPTFVAIWSKFSETKLGRPSLSQAKETPYCTEAGGLSRRMAPVSPLAVSEIDVPTGLTWRAHHAVAEALHLELANVASPSFAFALLTADHLVTLLLHRRLLRRVRRSRQHDERKHQQDHPHLSLQKVSAPARARLWAFMPYPRHPECEGRHTATPIPLSRRSPGRRALMRAHRVTLRFAAR
jgi:hypothetical protein